MDKEAGKRRAAIKAATLVERGMTLGLGTGSTAKYFIEEVGDRVKQGWPLRGIPTSTETKLLAEKLGIEIVHPDETTRIDLAVDGADEVDPNLNLIKGGGAALLREKIIANAAKTFVVIADKSKRVPQLGAFPLPVEIESFGWALTVNNLRRVLADMGLAGAALSLRAENGAPLQTDGGNLIVDCSLERIEDPPALETAIRAIPGVIENGLFCGMTDVVIFGDEENISVEKSR